MSEMLMGVRAMNESMLSQRYEFPIGMLNISIDEIEEYIARDPFFVDPIPDAKVIRVIPDQNDDSMGTAMVEMSVESFIRSNVQYGEDPYDILKTVKEVCGEEVAEVAVKFIQEAPDLTVAIIQIEKQMSSDIQISSDVYPTKPQL